MNLVQEDEGSMQKKSKKRFPVKPTFSRKTHREHILLWPDSYVGSTEPITQSMWVYDENLQAIINRDISFVPGLYKIFDEILGNNVNHFNGNCDKINLRTSYKLCELNSVSTVNAVDNKQRDPSMSVIKINIDA